jgi:hypothetical protein
MGEFSLVYLSLASICLFPCVIQKEVDYILPHGVDIPNDLLSGSAWHGSTDTFVCVAVPNVVLFYFGQEIPQGRITLDSTKAAFGNLGVGYETWINLANDSLAEDDNTDKVFENGIADAGNGATFGTFVSNYFHTNLVTYGVEVRRVGPSSTLTVTQSDFYPAIADAIKKNFCLSLPSAMSTTGQLASTVIVQHASEMGKKAEAEKGHTKLLLLHICGDIANKAYSNIALAKPSKGMTLVMSNERSGQASVFSDILRKGLTLAKKHDPNDIRSRELSLTNFAKTTSGHILLGNLSIVGIASLSIEPNAIDISAFFPQNDRFAIEADKQRDLASRMEEGLDVVDAHRSKVATAIKRVGKVTSIKDVTSLMVNVCTFMMVVTSSDSPRPLLAQMFTKIMTMTIDNDWDEWMVQCGGSVPNIHLLFLSYIDRIFVCFSKFATDINNTNVVAEKRPLSELDLSEIEKALAVLSALEEEVTRAQAQGVPPAIPAQLIARFSISGGVPSPPAGKVVATPPTMVQQKRDDKREPAPTVTGDSNTGNPAKKSRRTSSLTEGGGFVKKEMGMFYLTKPDSPHPNTFPPGVKEKICLDFTCKGRECLVYPCPLKHPRRSKDMEKADVEAIALHFKKFKSGWLSGFHFKSYGLSQEAETMLGEHTGIKGASEPR